MSTIGERARDILVWRVGLATWVKARDAPDLVPSIGIVTPPLEAIYVPPPSESMSPPSGQNLVDRIYIWFIVGTIAAGAVVLVAVFGPHSPGSRPAEMRPTETQISQSNYPSCRKDFSICKG